MKARLLSFPYLPDRAALLAKMRLEPGSDESGRFLDLLDRLAPAAEPLAAFLPAKVSLDVPAPEVLIEGARFRGALLRTRLEGADLVWPYLATCGRGISAAAGEVDGVLERFWADAIMEDALETARRGFGEYFRCSVYSGPASVISPGWSDGWPLEGQGPLFRLLADGPELCGVELSDSLTMSPVKSVSGIWFPGGEGGGGCAYCGREKCPERLEAFRPETL